MQWTAAEMDGMRCNGLLLSWVDAMDSSRDGWNAMQWIAAAW